MATPPASISSDPIWDTSISKEMLEKLAELTLEEKVQLLSGASSVETNAVPRLDISALKIVGSTSAVQGSDFHNGTPTCCFPNTAALASTWDKTLIEEMGRAVGKQAKYKAAQVVLGPTVNLHRDPRAGRNFEAFSEDPVLTGHMAVALVNGIQSQGVGTCVRHFVCNESETLRKQYSSDVDERTLREIYLAPFQWLVREAKPTAIMTSYNKINGAYSCETPLILDVLRQEWGFVGLVMSDWYGTTSSVSALEAGLDLEMPGPTIFRGDSLIKDIKDGFVSESLVDIRVREVLKLISRTSEAHSAEHEVAGEDEAASSIARRVASESIVLLKNSRNVLPINVQQLPKIAVIGAPSLSQASGGGSAAGVPHYLQRPYDFIAKAHPKPFNVHLSCGVQVNKVIPMVPAIKTISKNGLPGVDIVYWNDNSEEPALIEFLPEANLIMMCKLKPGLKATGFRYKMSTSIIPEKTGFHTIAVQTTSAFQLFVEGNEVLSAPTPDITTEDFLFAPSKIEHRATLHMIAGHDYSILLRARSRPTHQDGQPTPHATKLCFLEEFSTENAVEEASKLATSSDISILFAGRNADYESEGYDLESIKLLESEVSMIKAVASVSPKTVVVLNGGNPFDVSEWIDGVDAVLFAHYSGQEGAAALADVLTGAINPSGKLPMTWPKCIEDVPTFGNFPASDGQSGPEIKYEEGLKIGYRHYRSNKESSTAKWDFGFGLSYTDFEFSNLKASVTQGDNLENRFLDIKVVVMNTGLLPGAEVVQVYVEDLESSVWRPVKELKAFEKVFLNQGAEATVNLQMQEKYAFSFWEEKSGHWVAEKGAFRIHVGNLTTDVMLQEGYSWNGV